MKPIGNSLLAVVGIIALAGCGRSTSLESRMTLDFSRLEAGRSAVADQTLPDRKDVTLNVEELNDLYQATKLYAAKLAEVHAGTAAAEELEPIKVLAALAMINNLKRLVPQLKDKGVDDQTLLAPRLAQDGFILVFARPVEGAPAVPFLAVGVEYVVTGDKVTDYRSLLQTRN